MAFALSLGGVTFLLAVIWGSPFVELMRRLNLGKKIRQSKYSISIVDGCVLRFASSAS